MGDSDIEELQMPQGEWRGWIRNRVNHELEWCIVTAGLMGVFHDPEADQARIVLNLGEFVVKPLCEGAKRGSHAFTYVDDVYSVNFVSTHNARVIYTFGAETEDDFRTWYRALTGEESYVLPPPSPPPQSLSPSTSESFASPISQSNRHAAASRVDSGLGDEICSLEETPSDSNASSPRNFMSPNGFMSPCSSYKSPFESIQEADFCSGFGSHGSGVDDVMTGGAAEPDECERSGSSTNSSRSSISDSGRITITTPDSYPEKRERGSREDIISNERGQNIAHSGDNAESYDSEAASYDSELLTEDSNTPCLRHNAQNIRLSRSETAKVTKSVGDFTCWEEKLGGEEHNMLTKTYSLPMRSPIRKRPPLDMGGNNFDRSRTPSKSQEVIAEGTELPTATPPSPGREMKSRSANSDPVRKSRPIGSRMTVKASKFMGRMTQFRSQRNKAPLPRSAIAAVTIEGDLLRKNKNTIVPCYCVLSGTVLYVYKSQQSEDISEITIDVAKHRLSKLAAAKTENKELDCAFVLTPHGSSKEHVFVAKDLTLARRWHKHLDDIHRELEARQIRAMHSSAPDLASTAISTSITSLTPTTSSPSLSSSAISVNQPGSSSKFSPTLQPSGKYSKSKARSGSTFKRLALAEEEKRNSIAARMSRGSFLELYGHSEEASQQRRHSVGDDAVKDDDIDNGHGADDEDDAFIEINMDDALRLQTGLSLGDRAVSRSMDDLGATPGNGHRSHHGKPLALGRNSRNPRSTSRTKRQKRTVPIPASEVENQVRTGHLDIRKSGSWKRCWSVLTEDRLYLYRKSTDASTLDMLLLEEYEVQTAVPFSNSTKHRFAFELYHPKYTETQLACESLEDRTAWMEAISEKCKKHFDPESSGQMGSNEKISSRARHDSGHSSNPSHLSDSNKVSTSSSEVSDESPVMEKRKQIIEDKYERVKEAQDAEMLRVNTILNQRRMSADVKIIAVEKQLQQQRKQRKRRKGDEIKDVEGAMLEEQLEQLKTRLKEIEQESQETSLKLEEHRRAIESKKEVEFKILEQERKLQKHKKAAQHALQQIVKDISAITPPPLGASSSGRPRFDQIIEEAEEGDSDERKLSVASSLGISSSDSMGSLCDPKQPLSTSEASIPEASPLTHSSPTPHTTHPMHASQLISPSRRAAVSGGPRSLAAARVSSPRNGAKKIWIIASESSSDSSSPSGVDSPDLPRRNMNLVDELEEYFPSSDRNHIDDVDDVDGDEYSTRDKSKSFDSGIADEVDLNSNKQTTIISGTNGSKINGHYMDEGKRSGGTQGKGAIKIRTEVSEDVLRDIEEFERIAQIALEQATWMV